MMNQRWIIVVLLLHFQNYRTVMPEENAVKIRLPQQNGGDTTGVPVVGVPKLCDDVRIKFRSRSHKVPKGYESCAFYFW